MKVQPREFVEFTAFDENFLGFKHRCHIVRSDETWGVKLPVIKLFPAATVVFEPCAEERISIWPRWIIDEKNNPSKVHEFLAADDRRDNMFTYDRLLRPNEVRSIHIPAGLNVRVKLDAPYDEKWCPVEIPQLFNLEQGQVVDPGSYTFKPALVVSVEVINSQGQTVEGIPVRRLKDDRIWSVAHNTDESGIARFYVVPNTEGRFGVSYHGADGEYLRETIPYKINGEEDAGKEFSLQLSDEMLKHLFKSEIME